MPPSTLVQPTPAKTAGHEAALVAGVAIVLLSVLAGFGNFVAVVGLTTEGDAARTAADIAGSETLFRAGVVSLLLVVVLDVVAAWALHGVFRTSDAALSTLAAWLRLAYSAVFLVAIAQLLPAARAATESTVDASKVMAHVDAYGDVFTAALMLFGAHLAVLGVLAHRSSFLPRAVGSLLVLAGAGYVFDTTAAVLIGDSAPTVSGVTFVGEFVLAVMLIVRRRSVAGQ
ncbi:MAG: hypothetical protein JWP11_1714 [Frankiales bacterium]|nr:hypothetical protein [Frankiales bacterium]